VMPLLQYTELTFLYPREEMLRTTWMSIHQLVSFGLAK
jgi:hypothetical protein